MADEFAVQQYGEAYFPTDALGNILTACNRHNCALAGLEGFFYNGSTIVPDFNAIFDVTSRASWGRDPWDKIVKETNIEVKDFVESTCPKRDYVITVVIFSEDEYEHEG